MKRHPALEPFSRDHNDGLILARDLRKGVAGAVARIQAAWAEELRDHFAEEERLLIPLATDEAATRLRIEHKDIETRVSDLPEGAEELGAVLERHIRWEERVLFPEIEAMASPAQLAEVLRETEMLEERRWPNHPRRAKLVSRRWRARREH